MSKVLSRGRTALLVVGVVLVVVATVAGFSVGIARSGIGSSRPVAAASATSSVTLTATTPSGTPPATPLPQKPHTLATAVPTIPTGPNPLGNWMAVSFDYSYAACHGGNGGKRTYPLMYLTNTYPNSDYIMAWTSNQDISGDGGNELVGGHTQTIRVEPEYGPSEGVLSVKIYTEVYPYSAVQGHWTGTVKPC